VQSDRKGFLDAIKENRFDMLPRKVYADWLDEHGYSDEATEQRTWTAEKERSVEWMEELAASSEMGYGDRRLTYDELIQAGRDWLRDGDYFVQIGDESLRNQFGGNADEFWRHWQMCTGNVVPPDKWDSPFSCSC
jgi:uncharacterized protein (TIGR02996 family)